MEHNAKHGSDPGKAPVFRAKWVFIAFALIAAYFLITEHRAHLYEVLPYWPYLLLLACPLLHLFMHGGHGGHSGAEHRHGTDGAGAAGKGDRK
jgi:uncharacterized membrane protein